MYSRRNLYSLYTVTEAAALW